MEFRLVLSEVTFFVPSGLVHVSSSSFLTPNPLHSCVDCITPWRGVHTAWLPAALPSSPFSVDLFVRFPDQSFEYCKVHANPVSVHHIVQVRVRVLWLPQGVVYIPL